VRPGRPAAHREDRADEERGEKLSGHGKACNSVLFRFMHACSGPGHAPSLQR
jgi:hypothetical protein